MTEDDDDLGPAYSLPPDDAHPGDIAQRVMTYAEHRHLVENEISFGWLMRNEPKVKGNRVELGSVHETQHMGQGAFKDLFEHLFAQKRDQIVEAFALSPALLNSSDGEPLVKVLPAGGPLQPRRDFPVWECSGCGLRSTTPSLPQCQHGHNNCPMVALP